MENQESRRLEALAYLLNLNRSPVEEDFVVMDEILRKPLPVSTEGTSETGAQKESPVDPEQKSDLQVYSLSLQLSFPYLFCSLSF